MSEAECRIVSPGYFDALSIRLLNGRAFTDRDRAGSIEVAIVNKTMADRLFAGRDPVGKRSASNQARASTRSWRLSASSPT